MKMSDKKNTVKEFSALYYELFKNATEGLIILSPEGKIL